jgi:hypothetical protein
MKLVGADLVSRDDWLVEASEASVMDSVRIASKHTRRYGMTTVDDIRQELARPSNPLENADIDRLLRSVPSVRWHGSWLWVDKARDSRNSNRLINTARAILSVNSPQSVASIQEGARRQWKFHRLDILAPADALRGFLRASPYFTVKDDQVSHNQPLDYHDTLGDVSANMVDVLKSSPYQVMDRQSLRDACVDAGVSPSTFNLWTTYAEWMQKFAPNVWGLRGASPSPAVINAIQRAARARLSAEPRRKSWQWDADGTITHTMDVTTSMVHSGTFSFSAELHPMLAGKNLVIIVNGAAAGNAKVGEGHYWSWGWGNALKVIGAAQADVLRIRLNLNTSTAVLERGGQELWNS